MLSARLPRCFARLLRADAAAGHADRPRAAVGRHVSGVAAVDRPPARRADVAGAAHDLGLSGRLRLRAGLLRPAVRPARPHGRCCWRRSASISLATLACALSSSIEMLIARALRPGVGRLGRDRAGARGGARYVRRHPRRPRTRRAWPRSWRWRRWSAPLIGGVLQTAFGWRSNFVAAVLLRRGGTDHGVVPAAGDAAPARAGAGVGRLDVAHLSPLPRRPRLRHPSRHRDVLPMSGLFAWISSAAFVLQDIYGLSALAFGVAFAVGSSGYLVGTSIAARFVMRWGSGRTMGSAPLRWRSADLVMAAGAGLHAHSAHGADRGRSASTLVGMGMTLGRRRRPAHCCRFRTAPAPRRRCWAS